MDSTMLPEKWIQYLINQPESGMGYQVCEMVLDNGSVRKETVINCEHVLGSSNFPVDRIKKITVETKY